MPSVKVAPYRPRPIDMTPAELHTFSAGCSPEAGRVERLDVTGICPQCKHDVHYVVHEHGFGFAPASAPTATIETSQAPDVGDAPPDDTVAVEDRELLREQYAGWLDRAFTCNCGYAHDDKHNECGGFFRFRVDWQPNDAGVQQARISHSSLPLTAYDQDAAAAADAAASSELDRLRSAATSWRTGLAALLALVPTLVVVKGTETADKLSGQDKALVGIPIVVGVLLAVVAAFCAMRAAFGPLSFRETDISDAEARDAEGRRTLSYLWATALLTVAALVALAFAIAWAWGAPTSNPAYFSVTKKDGSVVCGTLAGVTSTALRVKTSGGQVMPVQLADVDSTSFATGC